VHLAGADLEVEPFQDVALSGAGVQVLDAQHCSSLPVC
jgi:hypothetical protein